MYRTRFHGLIGIAASVAALAFFAVPDADAQRPSLFGLQNQINQINAQLEQGQFPQLQIDNQILFGPTGECSIGIDPKLTGLIERDPTGFRLLGRNNEGCRLLFGPTDECTIEVNPQGPPGLLLYDPRCIRICVPPFPGIPNRPTLYWGPTNDCSIGIDPEFPGLVERDPTGFRLLGRDNQGCRLIFGPTMDCTVEVDPLGPEGLLLYDPRCIRICTRDDAFDPTLYWGPTNDCSIGIDRDFPGLVERDPVGFRLLGRNNEGCRLLFGPTDLCTIEISPPDGTGPPGLLLRDPNGVVVLNPDPSQPNILSFGPTGECRIETVPQEGMFFTDRRFFFNGPIITPQLTETSSRRFKEDIRPIADALQKIEKLQGVYFNWKELNGGEASLGFIAEDVASVLPELVTYEEDGKSARGLEYSKIVAIAVEGVKAQQQQIEKLESRNAELEQELSEMRALLEQIAEKLDEK